MAMAANNILELPFRLTVPVSLSDAIKQYISSKYDQHPDMFVNDLATIDRLRTEAIWVREAHLSGARKLQTYAAQLNWIGGKFPIDIGVDFTWYPALGYNMNQPVTRNNLRYELSNILYNLASLYSQLAASSNRTTGDGLKNAHNYFCLASGILSYLRTDIIPSLRSTPAEDMDTTTLESLELLFLAQAQEYFWQKARMGKTKDALMSKLAAQVSDFYIDAADLGSKSDAISSEWLHHMSAKHHHFAAVAQYRAACDCLNKGRFGEEIARLRDSLICINEGMKQSRWINKAVLGDLQGLKEKIQDDLRRADRDNDMIYLNPVPPKSELNKIERVPNATAKIPKEVSHSSAMIGENGEFGQPLFAKLVPFAVHIASGIYTGRRDQLVNHQVIEELESLSSQVQEALQSYGLPGSLQALERPLGIPPSHLSHAEEIRQQDGFNRLHKSLEDISKLRANGITAYQEGTSILKAEASEDQKCRFKFGTDRWNRSSSQEAGVRVYNSLTQNAEYLKSAANSDELIKAKLKEWSYYLKLLAGPERDIEAFVPSSRRAPVSQQTERESNRLRTILNEIGRAEARRKRAIQSLREKVKTDDVSSALHREAARLERANPAMKLEAANFEPLFSQRLQKFDSDIKVVQDEITEQKYLLDRLRSANKSFEAARQGEKSSATKERESALQKLDIAYNKYHEIANHLDSARKFYNDLGATVIKFRDDCKSFVHARQDEASRLETDMLNPPLTTLSTLSLSSPVLQPQNTKSPPNAPSYASRAPTDPPLAAPVPTRASPAAQSPLTSTWEPHMGIKFGRPAEGGGSGGQVGQGGGGGAWDPNMGFKFS
ncbi:MAG: pH-response regulator protein palA/rim20 [Vezdaea aestivalis]|nr:MAG: pH-response regulator protein palA/rim20 [Vezdaea aestivalis]